MKLLPVLLFAVPLVAQTTVLRGVVSDETGAVVPAAEVTLMGPLGARSTTTGNDGSYLFVGLPPGDYSVQASTPALALVQPVQVTLGGGTRTLNLQLKLAATKQEITVSGNVPTVSTDAANNASAMVIKGKDLEALSDDPEDLQVDLQAFSWTRGGSERRRNLRGWL